MSMEDIIFIVIIGLLFSYVIIDAYLLDKKIEKRRKEFQEERNKKRNENPIRDYPINIEYNDTYSGDSYSGDNSDSKAADEFKSKMFRNMGMNT